MACNLIVLLVMKVIIKVLKFVAVSGITLSIMASGVSGMVLCFGADGHFSLEIAHQGRCHDADNARDHGKNVVTELLATAGADCCGSCVDVPLLSDTMSQMIIKVNRSTLSTDEMAGVLQAASFDTGIDIDVNLNALDVLRCAPLRTSPSLIEQRTIVLRV